MCAAINSDATVIALGMLSGDVILWNVASKKINRLLKGHVEQVTCVEFSHGDRFLASASHDKSIKIWDPKTGEEVRTLSGHSHSVMVVSFDRSGKLLASGSLDDTIKLWDLGSGKETTLKAHSLGVGSLVLSEDGEVMASGGWDMTVRVWEVTSGKQIASMKDRTKVVALSRDGAYLATVGMGENIEICSFSKKRLNEQERREKKGAKPQAPIAP